LKIFLIIIFLILIYKIAKNFFNPIDKKKDSNIIDVDYEEVE